MLTTAGPPSLAKEQDSNAKNQTSNAPEIIVTAKRGAAEVEAETELGPEAIDSYGVSTIGEVLAEVQDDLLPGEQTVVIVNGRIVANSEIYNNFPTDAIDRVEILQPEAGTVIARTPNARVVNLVVRSHFMAWDGTTVSTLPTAGGTSNLNGSVKAQQIAGMHVNRYSFNGINQSILLASERPEFVSEFPEQAGSSLRERYRSFSGQIAHQRSLGQWSISATAEARASQSLSLSVQTSQIAEIQTETREISSQVRLIGEVASWGIRARLDGGHAKSTHTGISISDNESTSFDGELSVDHVPFSMPAGLAQLSLSATGSYEWSSTMGRTTPSPSDIYGVNDGIDRSSSNWALFARLQLPLVNRTGSFRGLGKIDWQFGIRLNNSSSGGRRGLDMKLAWEPWEKIRISSDWTIDYAPPDSALLTTENTLGTPIVVYDFATEQSVQIDQILGGNPDLLTPRRERWGISIGSTPITNWRIAANFRLIGSKNSRGIGRISNVSPNIEAAFPNRFQRGADGQLILLDRRPLNFSSSKNLALRSGLRFRIPLKRQSRRYIGVSISYSRQLINRTRFRADLPDNNLLSGDGSGVSRYILGIDLNYQSPPNWTATASLKSRSEYRIRQTRGTNSPNDLIVNPALNLDLRFRRRFRDTIYPNGAEGRGRQITRAELTFDMLNVLDSRQTARLSSGQQALGYNRDTIDPLGRTVRIKFNYRF